ncbi:ATP-dependent protease [Amylibacter ulvae]|uniref:ATP-dependent protease n=1 Tax=Paramylibacter ulvae TaxID=1651968 RepID=A0ABQ3CYC7_9RHOB|nr:LON peptidase substrate-binding domain-containing protein [Amylibacter ulvae]GHA47230.1 ATP-dependent protease [Amylibacter ulvae]
MIKIHSLADLPETIPVFPLPGALLLPRARLPLNIFEPRYLAMLDDVLKTDHRLIGMVQPREVPQDMGNPPLHQIGCAGRVSSFSETEDGRYMITLSGVSRFRIVAQNAGFTPYLRADVEWACFEEDLGPCIKDTAFDRPKFLKLLRKYFSASELSGDWDTLKDADEELLINSLSMLCPFTAEEKQALLETPSLQTRRETLVTLMEFALRPSDDPVRKIQ